MRLGILWRPGVIGVNAWLRAMHHQNVFHGVRSFLIFAPVRACS
jgi:hypothetical protein